MSAHDEVLSNCDFLCAILATIADDNVEVMGRAAASWCVLSRLHASAIHHDERVWGVLVARVAQRMPVQVHADQFWSRRMIDFPDRKTFYELCTLARLQRTGVPRAMTRKPEKLFMYGDGAERQAKVALARRQAREINPSISLLSEALLAQWLREAWERMDPLEREVYHAQCRANFRALGFDWLYRPLPGVRKLD
ncbi:MAG: hypothetical protein CMD92_03660 [Gammaproteobacteria bacterium]|nr:hypothetical protein [Gammaproteobacteria bacterium]|tara:strand:+ start:6219 stop:6803 length:585 start_codon:yes stop_codon:yes gene_type:complete